MSTDNDDNGDFGSLETYDPTDDVDLGDFGGGTDESPDMNEDGEIISDGEDDVRDFASTDERDVSSGEGEDTTETRKTTLDQQGLDGENIFAGSSSENTDDEEFKTYDPTEGFENPHAYENADKNTPPTWETTKKTPSHIRWSCETDEHVSVVENDDGTYTVQRERADRTPVDTIAGKRDSKGRAFGDGEGIPEQETAIEMAYAYMEGNACLSEGEVYGDEALDDASTGAGALVEENEYHGQDELESRKIEQGNQYTERNGLPEGYDPTDDLESHSVLEDEEYREDEGEESDKGKDDGGDDDDGDCHDPVEVGFGSRDVANSVRDENEEYLCPLDDRRRKTVAFVRDTPDEVLDEARATAAETRADKTKNAHGQVELTDREKNQIDFSDVSVFHARTVKGIALDRGVKNWLDYYDTTLQANEHIETMENAEAASRLDSDELDEETIDEKISETQSVVESEECDHAERGCEDGYEEACGFLEEECDVPQSRIDELLDEDNFEDDVRDLEETDFDAGEMPLSVRVALKKAWRGYRAGRAEAKDGGSAAEARTYAGIINSIRQAVGQEMIEFEPAGNFEGGVIEPSEVGAEFEPRFGMYDPTEEFA